MFWQESEKLITMENGSNDAKNFQNSFCNAIRTEPEQNALI